MNEALENDTEIVCHGKTEDFAAFLAKYDAIKTFPGEILLLMERQPTDLVEQKDRLALLLFERYSREAAERAVDYTTGRIFSKEFELRWERRGHETRMTYIGSKQYAPALADVQEIPKAYQRQSRSYYLYGLPLNDSQIERIGEPAQAGDFAEARIPRLLRYPPLNDGVPPTTDTETPREKARKKMMVCVEEYSDPHTGELIFFRFTGRKRGSHESV